MCFFLVNSVRMPVGYIPLGGLLLPYAWMAAKDITDLIPEGRSELTNSLALSKQGLTLLGGQKAIRVG